MSPKVVTNAIANALKITEDTNFLPTPISTHHKIRIVTKKPVPSNVGILDISRIIEESKYKSSLSHMKDAIVSSSGRSSILTS